jgi:peroxiredoxin
MHAWLIAALVVSWVLVFALAGALFVLIKQHGDLIIYQQDLDHRLEISSFFEGKRAARDEAQPQGAEMEGLPVGTEAPEFAAKDLEGNDHSLADYRGEPFVLAFFSDTCGYCKDLAPDIGVLPAESRKLVLLSHGDVEAHKQMAAENNWQQVDVLIEPEYDAMMAYGAMGTPAGYLIDADGKIASKLALGGGPVLDLVLDRPPPDQQSGDAAEPSGNGHVPNTEVRVGDPLPQQNGTDQSGGSATATATAGKVKTRDVSESSIVRDGIPPGVEAPNFVLRDLDGKTHSLLDYRGQRVLLVFSDVDCGPCEYLSPPLVELAEKKARKVQVLMITRGDEERNREKAAAFGYTFPVLLQKSWEISKLYGMFATPIGYLIDKDGIIEKEVAVGPEPILELV